jgi:hypothetical protein
MSLTERFLAGFALAATIARDPGAQAARTGLADAVAEPMTEIARQLLQLGKTDRRARIRALTEPPAHTLSSPMAGHRRALALLAHKRSAGTGAGAAAPAAGVRDLRDLRDLPLPRPGYAPEPVLTALLARIAARSQKAAE